MTDQKINRPQTADPRKRYPQPPFPVQKESYPGESSQMQPQPDYGEEWYKGCNKLDGKAALITGADSGIGRAVALAFAREGADVLISYLDEDQDAQETERLVKEAGRKAVRMAGDITDPKVCQQLVQRAMDEFGHLEILVNNAAFQMSYKSLEEIPLEDIDHTFRTNIMAMFYLCKAALPNLRPGSSIINTASIQAYQPSGNLLPYAATKGAIVTFTKGLAKELADRGIRANAVAPGPVWTPLIPATMPPEEKVSTFGQNAPLGRPAQPVELAPIYVLLASDDASFMTGGVYDVTGGEITA